MPYVVLTDGDSIMECSSAFEEHPVPPLLRHLLQSRIISETDAISIASLERSVVEKTKNGRTERITAFKKEDFPEIRAIAARYQIYALPGTLEDVLGLVVGGRRKFRDILELVDSEYGTKPIPEEIKRFFEYAYLIKKPVRGTNKAES